MLSAAIASASETCFSGTADSDGEIAACHGGELGRPRLREGAMRDLGQLQHERVHCFGEGRVQRVGHERFGDLVTAARVVIGAAGHGDHRHRRRVRKRRANKNLRECRQRGADLIADKTIPKTAGPVDSGRR